MYSKELLERKQQETEEIIRDTLLNLSINGTTLSNMHTENVVLDLLKTLNGQGKYLTFIIDLIKSLENNEVLLANLKALDKAGMISDVIRRPLTMFFACICANFDACIFLGISSC